MWLPATLDSCDDANRSLEWTASLDEMLELVNVDPRKSETTRLAELVPDPEQALSPPADDVELFVELAPLVIEDVHLVHHLSLLGSVGVLARAHRSSERDPSRFGETRAIGVGFETATSGADPHRLAAPDLKLPAGEIEQFEQEGLSFTVRDEIGCHDANARERSCVRPERRLSFALSLLLDA